jgi:glyceraldehyde-3-phosphate dehydrogenase type I
MRIAINGFGRIGKNFLRAILLDPQARSMISVAAINIGPSDITMTAHAFKYDTLLGTYPGQVSIKNNNLVINDMHIQLFASKDPRDCAWKDLKIDWVVDCSGKFTHREKALEHVDAGASYVLISAPAHDEDIAIIPGINHKQFNPQKHKIVSLGSCTTNAFMPMLWVVHRNFGLKHAVMTTVHAYTNSQVLLDNVDSDPRRARAAALNIIPTRTGAADMVHKIMPEIADRVYATALRVPLAIVSLIDLTIITDKPMTNELLNGACSNAAHDTLKGIMSVTDEPLVSSDFAGNDNSVIIDRLLTTTQGNVGKLFGWYDNEWGYSQRLKDFLCFVNTIHGK